MPEDNVIVSRYYPQLSDLITVDDLPDFLDFAKEGLDSLLSSIFYKNFQYSKSQRSDSTFYKIEIITSNLGLDLPFGLRFILNPDASGDTNISSFPVTLQYQWTIFSFLRSFDLSSVSLDPSSIFQLGLNVFKVSDQDLVAHVLNFFVSPLDDATTIYEQLVNDINAYYPSANITIPPGQTASISLITSLISENANIPDSISEVMFVIYLFTSDSGTLETRLQQFFTLISPGGIQNFISGLVKPKFKASLTLSAGLEFPTNILQPVDASGNIIPNEKTIFQFGGATFYVDTDAGIGSQVELAGSLIPTYNQIANTGLIISITGAKLDLSQTTNIPEATAAGFPVDFMGLYVKQASITLGKFGKDDPSQTSATITATNFLIGTGGVSGTIAMQEQGGIIHRDFGNFKVELDAFSLTFRQNAITACSITGAITLDKYTTNGQPSKISIVAQIKDAGDFSITATPSANFPPITLPGVFTLAIRQLVVGEEQPKGYYVQVAGTLTFIADLPILGDVLPKNINISKLRIWDDGSIDFVGGQIKLPVAFTLKIGPVKLEVKNMSLGSYSKKLNGVDRSYCYFSFDGMVNTGNAGVEVGGNGIKFYFTVDDGPNKPFDCYIRIDQIDIDITIPGNAKPSDADFILQGHLSVSNPNPNASSSTAGTEYGGSVSVSIPKIGLTGSAGMRLNPAIPSFIVDLNLDLSIPIPIGGTGLSIYGFRGLIGEHYLPSKSATTPPLPDTATWWDYYKAKNVPDGLEGIEIDKFADEAGFSLGAGIAIATDGGGYVFSSKLFLLLGIPDVILIQGQAGILQDRIGLTDKTDPPFSALIAIDSTSFTGDLSVNYNLPSDSGFKGDIFSLQGSMDMAFFFNNASGWYINLGKDQPASARIQAKILDLFKGYAYLMISSQGFKVGAGAGYSFNKKIGPVGVNLSASLDMGAFVSFKPVQAGGFISVSGEAYLKFFWLKIGAGLGLTLAVEAPHPFNITGKFQIRLHVFIHTFTLSLPFSWSINNNNAPLLQPVQILQLPDPASAYSPAVAVNIMSQETFPVNYVNQVYQGSYTIPAPGQAGWQYDFTDTTAVMQVTVPLDSYIDIELLKPVIPGNVPLGGAGSQLPDGYTDLLPPVKGLSAQVKHSYSISALDIFVWDDSGSDGGSWMPYQVYEAVTAIVDGNTGNPPVDLSSLPQGYWQFVQPNTYNKIRLLSQTMFSYSNGSDSAASNLDMSNFQRKALFCYETISEEEVVNWKGETLGTVYAEGSTVMISGVSFTFNELGGSVNNDAGFGYNSLFIESLGGSILITLPEQVTQYEIDFGSNQNDLLIYPVVTNYVAAPFGQTIPMDTYLTPGHLSATQQNTSITYNDPTTPVDKILIIIDTIQSVDFIGDLNMGGYFQLSDQFLPVSNPQFHHEYDVSKALMYVSLFNTSLSASDILQKQYSDTAGVVGQWPLNSGLASIGSLNANLSGDPDLVPGYYPLNNTAPMQLQNVFSYSDNTDALIVPYNDALKVETGSFSFEVTALFDAYTPGISTLLSKVYIDQVSSNKKGYALHLYKQTAGDPLQTYTDISTVPSFFVWLTCYDGQNAAGVQASETYTLDYTTGKLAANQYKHIIVTVNRDTNLLSIYIDRVLKTSVAIPVELAPINIQPFATYVDQLSYLTTSVQERQQENNVSPDTVINEAQILSDNLNKVIQPVWRPNTTFAVAVTTKDTVNSNTGGAIAYTQIFGFRTAGPVGLFQQQSAAYQALVQADQTDMFKLADLTDYIDYNRSSPDAQGRFNMSKPVFYTDPQISLIFTMPYINAMYSNWDSYQGLPAIQSSLQIQLIDPYGNTLSPQLVWSQLPDQTIDSTNYTSLPNDQQLIFLLDQAASQDSCNPNPITLTKQIKQGTYQFPDLTPNKLYTAVFNAVYQPAGEDQQVAEVHKFGFLSSLFATFQEQAGSFILDDTPGAERYALYSLNVGFTAEQLTQNLLPLLNNDADNNSPLVMQYPAQFDRIIFGGCQLKAFEPSANTIINLLINTDPGDGSQQLLGIIIRNPEPFNDPKLPANELSDTFRLTLTQADGTVIPATGFIYIYSSDTSAVLITNSNMQLSAGDIVFTCHYKIFNGIDYDTEHEDYTSPSITIAIS
ncbi:hypothetical protein HDF18_08465 [Mucilaginibacter sp. X5P1]|uniref:hypothetical protein n=1 Tax=Mucilaginibacter sp. X5P1 TaxID=2723088 RepID=UPI0016169939|nr:hypothetical protein [Mucilaginibacter sp. X5P1]MBB6137690.1 hypothetical protein [Mucilaginibacter sp. X5P1]